MRPALKFMAMLLLAGPLWVGACLAEEPAQEFLEALRENGYHDVALDYLTSLEGSDLISAEFRRTLPFERAETLIASVGGMRDLKEVDRRLDEAQQLLDRYASSDSSLQEVARTRRFSGRLLSQRADIYLRQAGEERLTAGERNELLTRARGMLQGALTNFQQAKEQLKRLLDPESPDAVKIDPDDPATLKVRRQLQSSYTQVTVQLPKVMEQLSDTYPQGDPQKNQLLLDAVADYERVWDAYNRYPAGVEACVFAGRCNQKLGKHKEALQYFSEVFGLADLATVKDFKKEAYVLATDSWRATEPYPHKEVIAVLEPVVRALNRLEVREEPWLKVQLELALAKQARSEEIKAAGGPQANSNANTMLRAAAKVLRNVARVPSPYRDRARELLSEWDIPLTDVAETAEAPQSFDDALQLGRDGVAELEVLAGELSEVRRELAAAEGAQANTLQAQIDDLQTQLTEQADATLQSFDLALSLADEETSRGDLNTVRYLQSFCYFVSGRLIESALISEFLLTKYPTEDGTRPATSLLIQSYSALLDQADPEDREFERQRLQQACEEALSRWPGSNEAGLAASTMTRLALVEEDLELAARYIDQVPTTSVARRPLAIRLGRQLWMDYKRQLSDGAAAGGLKELLDQACTYMEQGVTGLGSDAIDYETALGALMLVDARLVQGRPEEAVRQLEAAEVAPLDLVKQKHPSISQASTAELYNRETYKVAIKTYLAALQNGNDRQKWVDKANGILSAMRQEMEASGDPQDRLRVTAVYQLIAVELKKRFDEIQDPNEKIKFAEILGRFLGSIERESKDARTVLWAGSTMLNAAGALQEADLGDAAQPLFQQAVSALSRAESLGFAGEENAEQLGVELRRQRALAQRGSGAYEQAVAQFEDILKDARTRLDIQIDAAETLQQWGKSAGLSRPLAEATNGRGSMEDPKTGRPTQAIWGWKKILMATRGNEKFRDTYYLSLYNVIEGRWQYGKIENSRKAIDAALSEIERARERSPDFDGLDQWKARFDQLEKRIREDL